MGKPVDRGIAARRVRKLDVKRSPASIDAASPAPDELVIEEPLEIRVAAEPMSLTMRTPGDDHRLAVGFLFAEGVIESIDDVGTVAHCGRPGEEEFRNVIDVAPGPGVALDPDRLARTRRGTLTTAACGVCGRQSIDDLVERCRPVEWDLPMPLEVVAGCTDRLREAQHNFARTGGIHAAAALTAQGELLAAGEDVGRHNAVDKVLGRLLYDGLVGRDAAPGAQQRPALLVVSGRSSFEMVQKAAVARMVAVAGVSAPTSLAVDLAEQMRITLAGFVRRGRMNVYTHPERIVDGQ